MPDATAAPPTPEVTQAPAAPPKPKYTLKFEPIGTFDLKTLFVDGTLKGRFWLTDDITIDLKSLTGEEVDEVNASVFKISEKLTRYQYNTEITYRNLALATLKIGDETPAGNFEEKVAKVKKRAGSVIGRMQLAYMELNDRIDELYVSTDTKDQEGIGKKS